MNIYGGLLFMQGHITNVALAKQLANDSDQPSPGPANGRCYRYPKPAGWLIRILLRSR